jgi:nucleosome binding factor SPN SPT16 subunit
MSEVSIDADRFFTRIKRVEEHLASHKGGVWEGCESLCIPLGTSDESVPYSKSASMHLYLLGYEFPNSIMLLTKGNFYFMATAEKCKYLKDSILPKQDENASIKIHLVERSKDSGANRELMHDLLGAVRKNHGSKLASLFKTDYQGKFVPEWMEMVKGSGLDMIEATPGLSHLLSTKDETELVSTFYLRSIKTQLSCL